MFKNNIRMADEGIEQNSSSEKTEVKEDVSLSRDKTAESADTSSKEEKKTKIEKSSKKDEKATKIEKSVSKEEKKEDDSSEYDENDEEELPPGLLERPLEVEGKREKKKVERLSATMIRSPQDKKMEIEEGSGTKLGDIPYVEHQLNITKAIDLKPLHRVLFFRAGAVNEIKKNIRQFNGFSHSKDSKEHEKRVATLNKLVTAELKAICLVLGLERSGTKSNLVDRVMDFLKEPEDKGHNVKVKAKKRSTSTGGKTKSTKKKKTKKTIKKGKVDKSDDSSLKDNSDEEEVDEKEEDEEEEDEEEEESEDEVPKKKKTKTDSKKKPPKTSTKENGKKEKPAPKEKSSLKEKKKPVAKKRAAVESDSVSGEDSEDEPIAKMKKSPPSNEEIKELVKNLLNGADLEKVTMKTVVKQVYAKYPAFDLSDRKDLIKDTVREVIS